MNRVSFVVLLTMFAGCTTAQIAQLQTDEQAAETTYSATTQATAAARISLATQPADTAELKALTATETGEQTARLALDLSRAVLVATQNRDASDPALSQSLAAAISAIPSPWTPILASLIPAAVPLVVSVVQSVKLGRAHQTVANVTEQLEAHKAALDALTAKPDSTADTIAGLPL